MANLHVLDGAGADKYLEAVGAGSPTDPNLIHHVARVGINPYVLPVPTSTTPYTVGDNVGGIFHLANVNRQSGSPVRLFAIRMKDNKNAAGASFMFHFFDQAPSVAVSGAYTDNAPQVIEDADYQDHVIYHQNTAGFITDNTSMGNVGNARSWSNTVIQFPVRVPLTDLWFTIALGSGAPGAYGNNDHSLMLTLWLEPLE